MYRVKTENSLYVSRRMTLSRDSLWQRIALFGCVLLFGPVLISCSGKEPRPGSPEIILPEQYPRQVEQEAGIIQAQMKKTLREREAGLLHWWQRFDSDELNQLADRALAHNPELQALAWQVVQAQARHRQAVAENLPVITFPAGYRLNSPANGPGSLGKHESRDYGRDYHYGLKGQWQPDLWGEKAASVQSRQALLDRAVFLYDDRQRTLIQQIVTHYVEFLSLNDRLRNAKKHGNEQSSLLARMKRTTRDGKASAADINMQQALVMNLRASIPALIRQREEVRNQIAELVGSLPGKVVLSERGLDSLTFDPELPILPPQLILKRPDIRAAEARLLSANANIEVARARLLPSASITAQIRYGTRHLSELFQPQSLFLNFVAGLTAEVFDGGRKNQQVKYSVAAREQMMEMYIRTVYRAIKEVDDATVGFNTARQRLQLQLDALDEARKAKKVNARAYSLGQTGYLNLSDATRTTLRDSDQVFSTRMEQIQALALVYSALGGGVTQRAEAVDRAMSSVQSDTLRKSLVKGWQLNVDELAARGNWQVLLAGIHNHAGVAACWRDFAARFPEQTKGYRLLAATNRENTTSQGANRPLFQLYVDAFASQAQANRYCQRLRKKQQRCRAVRLANIDNLAQYHLIALSDWPDKKESERFEIDELLQNQDIGTNSNALPSGMTTPLTPEQYQNYSNHGQAKPPSKETQKAQPEGQQKGSTKQLATNKTVKTALDPDNSKGKSRAKPGWSIVVGSFLDQLPLKKLQTRLARHGYRSTVMPVMVDGEKWRRVVVAGRSTAEATERLLTEIQDKLDRGSGWVIKNR